MARRSFGSMVKHAWNVFTSYEEDRLDGFTLGPPSLTSGSNRASSRYIIGNDRSIVSTTIMRIGIDAASVDWYHARIDDNGYFTEVIDSGLNECLTVSANLDQSAQAFKQDVIMTMCEMGVVAIVPVDTTLSPLETGGFDIKSLRCGPIVGWHPQKVTVRLYNETKGISEDITIPKSMCAIVENPLYQVMNEPNSTLQRLIRKLALLDTIDEAVGSGKIDIIVQLPYVVKSESRQQMAQQRIEMVEAQLKDSKYGVAYMDATEKITQLNRPAENNMLTQVEYLTEMLYGQLGITKEVVLGTADEATMLNYQTRTITPMLKAVTGEMKRKFLTKTARTQKQSVVPIRDPFATVAVKDLAELADKLTRNEILSSNEVRGIIGRRPSSDPKADELRNKNIPEPVPTDAPALPAAAEPAQLDAPPQRLAIEAPPGARAKEIMEGRVN